VNTSFREFPEAGMLASELLGLPVEDSTGRGVGTVIDVRLVVEGDLHHDPGQPRILGLVVSPRTRSSYLGYERTGVKHPVLLQKLLRWRHRGTFVCAWSDVARIDTDRVSLESDFTRYSPLLRT
jgi:sporulation protein YlmC with PRC-barrel domain